MLFPPLGALIVALALFNLSAGTVAAQPPYDHPLTIPGTGRTARVGPPCCDVEHTDVGFTASHAHVHEGEPGTGEPGLLIAADPR